MSAKRTEQDAKRRDKDRCRSAKTKEGLRKLQELVSQTEAVVNRLADLDADLVTKATVIVARQRGRNGGKSVSPRSKSSLSSQETLQETPIHDNPSKNVETLQDRENSPKVYGDNKSYANLQAEDFLNENGVSTEDDTSSHKMDDNTDVNDSQSQSELQVQTNIPTVADESKTHSADGNFAKIDQPENKGPENHSNSDTLTQSVSKPGINGEETTDTEDLSPSIAVPTDYDEKSDTLGSDVTVSQQYCDVTPATGKQTPDKTGDSNSGQQPSANNRALPSSPTTVAHDDEEDIAAKQSASSLIKIEVKNDVDDQKDPDHYMAQVEVCTALMKDEGMGEEKEFLETTNPQNDPPAQVDGDSPVPDVSSNQHPLESQQSECTNTNQQPLQETPTNEQSASTNPPATNKQQAAEMPTNQKPSQETPSNKQPASTKAPKANQQQLPKNAPNQHQPPKTTQTQQQSKSTKVPSTNQKPTPKVTTNEKPSPKDKPEANQKPSPSNLTKTKSPSTNNLAPKQNDSVKTSAKKQPSSIASLPKIQYPALKKQKPLKTTETQSNSMQVLPKIRTKKQSTSPDTLVSNEPPQKNTGSNLSQSTKSQVIGQQSQPEDVFTNKETASPRTLRTSFPIITYQQSPSPISLHVKSPSPTSSNPLSPAISQESLSTTPSNQELSITPVTTNQQPPSPTTKVQLLPVDQSDASRPSTGTRSSIATPSSASSLGQRIVKEDPSDGTKQNGPELSPAPQRHMSKAKADVRKKLQGKLRQRRGQRV
ncbi:hypothetical protein Bbelb_189890 [Branchiostoma belcheri]|nr:hypothetical protein Bbelb_189890 [Branchiostoma belcheri]